MKGIIREPRNAKFEGKQPRIAMGHPSGTRLAGSDQAHRILCPQCTLCSPSSIATKGILS